MGPEVSKGQRLFRLRLGDHLIQTYEDGELATLQSAVALLRTVFEDHFVDVDHQSCLFFHGCTIAGSQNRAHDFAVVHRGDRVFLSDFTFKTHGPACVSLPVGLYAREVIRFAEVVLATGLPGGVRPVWQRTYMEAQWAHLCELVALTERYLTDEADQYPAYCEEFQDCHGCLKRPMEVQVIDAEPQVKPREPVMVLAKVRFGPLRLREKAPMRLNYGDVILMTVNQFTSSGVLLTLEGVGSGGVRSGDRLFGLQTFYP